MKPIPISEPKIASHRKDVAAYFLAGGAAITLTVAGSFFSSNPPVAIFWFLATGILTVTSGSFFWSAREKNAAIFWVWLGGVLLVCAGCGVWSFEQSHGAPPLHKPTPALPVAIEQILTPASPTPVPTPPSTGVTNNALTEFRFTPKQIVDKIKAESGWKQTEIRKAFEGLPVDWVVLYFTSTRLELALQPAKLYVAFRSDEPLSPNTVLVTFPVPLKGNEHLPLTEQNRKFRVRGVIGGIDDNGKMISLREGAIFEPLPQ
jgi:hypothetical protein